MELAHLLALGLLLFGVGAGVFFTRRTPIVMLCGVELMLNAANVNLVAFSRLDAVRAEGQVFALFVMVIATAETAVVLAILYALSKQTKRMVG
jgi:NADH:ubiquinone oxidoreductase subunit K